MRVITDRIGISALYVDETLADPEDPLYFHHRVVEPGSRAHAAHTHDADQVEAFFIIEGEAEVQIEDEIRHLRAGEGAVINTRRRHGFRNIGAAPLRYVVMTAPGPPPAAAIGRTAPSRPGRG
ncbi:MAG: cupin domain-containing protein [Chloroflexi bacterium]|nr:cupin domain-containing protein [Chloroflexota bacterium]